MAGAPLAGLVASAAGYPAVFWVTLPAALLSAPLSTRPTPRCLALPAAPVAALIKKFASPQRPGLTQTS